MAEVLHRHLPAFTAAKRAKSMSMPNLASLVAFPPETLETLPRSPSPPPRYARPTLVNSTRANATRPLNSKTAASPFTQSSSDIKAQTGLKLPSGPPHTGIQDLPDACLELVLNSVEKFMRKVGASKSSPALHDDLLRYATVSKDWKRAIDVMIKHIAVQARGRPHIERKSNKNLEQNLVRFPNLEEISLQLSGVGSVTNWKSFFRALAEHCHRFNALHVGQVDPLSAMSADDLETLCSSLIGLQRLSLESALDPRLAELPDCVGSLPCLEELRVYETMIATLPRSLANLQRLRVLNLSCLSLQVLPPNIGNLVALEELVLVNCSQLTTLPESVQHLSRLRRLVIDRCGLQELPECLSHLSSLQDFELRACMWLTGALPEWLGNFGCLRRLCVWRCGRVSSFPPTVCQLLNLEELRVDYCRGITELPTALLQLPKLCNVSVDPRLCQAAA